MKTIPIRNTHGFSVVLEMRHSMHSTGMNNDRIRKSNRAAILNIIAARGPLSRKDIAELSGLTPASLTQITAPLIQNGLLLESGKAASGSAGRNKVLLSLNYDFCHILCFHIERENTVLSVCNLRGDVLRQKKYKTTGSRDPEHFLSRMAAIGLKMTADLPVRGASVSISGLVDRESGVCSHTFGIWDGDVPLRSILEKNLDLPVTVENNVNAFAKAEIMYGVGREKENLLLIKWGPGVGSAIVVNGEIYEGRHGRTAEPGHFIVVKNGALCKCGRRGCLETVVSYEALQKIRYFQEGELEQAYLSASKKEKQQFDEAFDLFARTILNAITALAPDRIVLYGNLFKSDTAREKVLSAIKQYDPHFYDPRIIYSSLRDQNTWIGPVAAYAQKLFEEF